MKGVKKFLLSLTTVFCLIISAFLLTACGEDSNENGGNTQPEFVYLLNIDVSASPNSAYYEYWNDDEDVFYLPKNSVFELHESDFIVTLRYSNGTSETTDLFTISQEEDYIQYQDYNEYYIRFIYDGNEYGRGVSVRVDTSKEQLPILTGFTYDEESGYYNLDHEFRYEEDTNYSPIPYIGTADGETLQDLIDAGKVTVSCRNSNWETLDNNEASEPNSFSDGEYYNYYHLNIEAGDDYCWKTGEYTTNYSYDIRWQIKRKILASPEITTEANEQGKYEFSYAHTNDDGNLVGINQGLTYDLKGNGDLLNLPYTSCSAGTYDARVSIKYPESNLYAFLNGNDEEVTSLFGDITYEIKPMSIGINQLAIAGETNANGEHHYTYTGSPANVQLNIDNEFLPLLNEFYISTNASEAPYILNLYFYGYDSYQDKNNEKWYLKNYVYANGDAIETYNGDDSVIQLSYYIDRVQTRALTKEVLDEYDQPQIQTLLGNQIEFIAKRYHMNNHSLTGLYDVSNGEDTAFSEETIELLNSFGAFNNGGHFRWSKYVWNEENACYTYSNPGNINIGNNSVKLYYYANPETVLDQYDNNVNVDYNYIPYEFTVNVTLNKGQGVLQCVNWNNTTHTLSNLEIYKDNTSQDIIDRVSYEYFYKQTEEGTFATVDFQDNPNLTDAGYYKVTVNLQEDPYYEYTNLEDVYSTWEISKTYIYMSFLTDGFVSEINTNSPEELDSYYYEVENTPVQKTVTYSQDNINNWYSSQLENFNNYFDYTTKTYFKNGNTWVEAEDYSAIGKYKSCVLATLKEGLKLSNFDIYGAEVVGNVLEIAKEWNIYNNTYTFTTEGENPTLVWEERQDNKWLYTDTVKYPNIIIPEGLHVSYMEGVYGTGSSDNYFSEEKNSGYYQISGTIGVKSIPGYDKVTVTIDGKIRCKDGNKLYYYYENSEEPDSQYTLFDEYNHGEFYSLSTVYNYVKQIDKTETYKSIYHTSVYNGTPLTTPVYGYVTNHGELSGQWYIYNPEGKDIWEDKYDEIDYIPVNPGQYRYSMTVAATSEYGADYVYNIFTIEKAHPTVTFNYDSISDNGIWYYIDEDTSITDINLQITRTYLDEDDVVSISWRYEDYYDLESAPVIGSSPRGTYYLTVSVEGKYESFGRTFNIEIEKGPIYINNENFHIEYTDGQGNWYYTENSKPNSGTAYTAHIEANYYRNENIFDIIIDTDRSDSLTQDTAGVYTIYFSVQLKSSEQANYVLADSLQVLFSDMSLTWEIVD